MATFSFTNLTLWIDAKDGKEAYQKLCNMVASYNASEGLPEDTIGYETDTYACEDGEGSSPYQQRSTTELMPKC